MTPAKGHQILIGRGKHELINYHNTPGRRVEAFPNCTGEEVSAHKHQWFGPLTPGSCDRTGNKMSWHFNLQTRAFSWLQGSTVLVRLWGSPGARPRSDWTALLCSLMVCSVLLCQSALCCAGPLLSAVLVCSVPICAGLRWSASLLQGGNWCFSSAREETQSSVERESSFPDFRFYPDSYS